MIFHDRRLIFVHIQKTGGNAVCAALGRDPNCPEKHFTARDLASVYGSDAWRGYYKFAFVRNPWDRLVSWWSMIDRQRASFAAGTRFNAFQTYVLTRARTFTEFLTECTDEVHDADGVKWIFRNQIEYLTDPSGALLVDFTGRFETLQSDFDVVAKNAGFAAIPLPRVNNSSHGHYSTFYTPELAAVVQERFSRDIGAFGYSFERG